MAGVNGRKGSVSLFLVTRSPKALVCGDWVQSIVARNTISRYVIVDSQVPCQGKLVKGSVCMGIGGLDGGVRALLFVCGTERPSFGQFDCGLGRRVGRFVILGALDHL